MPDTAVFDVDGTSRRARLDVPTLGVLTGGFSEEELTEAGAAAVYSSVRELLDGLDDSQLARPS